MQARYLSISFIAVFIISGFNSIAQTENGKTKKTDAESYELKGKVKSMTDLLYEVITVSGQVKKGNIEEDSHENYKLVFDEKGNIIYSESYGTNGKVKSTGRVKFDSAGNEIETDEYKPGGALLSKEVYKYDAMGDMIEDDEYDGNVALLSAYTYKYDSSGNQVEELKYSTNGYFYQHDVSKYSKRSKVIEYKNLNKDGSGELGGQQIQ